MKKDHSLSVQSNQQQEIVPNLHEDKKKHIRRIGIFADFKGIKFKSKEHQRSFITRNVRAARLLAPYSDERIIEVLNYLRKNANFKITLETVGKYIDENLEELHKRENNNNIVIG